MKEIKPLVSVCCLTYNHEKFINQCLDGFLMQKTNFDVEFIIHDDASTDDTQNIILSRVSNDKRFKLFFRKTNLWSTGAKVFPVIYKKAKGKYIALCEGDDYWENPLKLQIQFDFLEENQNYSLVGNDAIITNVFTDTGKKVKGINSNFSDYKTSDLIVKNPFVTATVMFKNYELKNLNEILNEFSVGDWPLFTFLSEKGKCRFYSEAMGFYRLHPESMTSKNRSHYKMFKKEYINRIYHAEFWNKRNNNIYDKEELYVKIKRSRPLVAQALRNFDFETAIKYSQFINVSDLDNTKSKFIAKFLQLLFKLNFKK